MPRTTYAQKKRKKRWLNVVLWIVTIAVACGVAIYLVSNYYDSAKNKFEQSSYPKEYSDYVDKAAKEYNLKPALIYAIMRTESNFDPDAKSEAGACGIMQMMPSSFEWLQEKRGEEGKYSEKDLFNPEICIDYGSYLLKYFYDLYGTENAAIAAYNAGFVVGDWLSNSEYSTDGKTLVSIPYPETSNYVEKVEAAEEMYIKLYYS